MSDDLEERRELNAAYNKTIVGFLKWMISIMLLTFGTIVTTAWTMSQDRADIKHNIQDNVKSIEFLQDNTYTKDQITIIHQQQLEDLRQVVSEELDKRLKAENGN